MNWKEWRVELAIGIGSLIYFTFFGADFISILTVIFWSIVVLIFRIKKRRKQAKVWSDIQECKENKNETENIDQEQ